MALEPQPTLTIDADTTAHWLDLPAHPTVLGWLTLQGIDPNRVLAGQYIHITPTTITYTAPVTTNGGPTYDRARGEWRTQTITAQLEQPNLPYPADLP